MMPLLLSKSAARLAPKQRMRCLCCRQQCQRHPSSSLGHSKPKALTSSLKSASLMLLAASSAVGRAASYRLLRVQRSLLYLQGLLLDFASISACSSA